MSIFTPESVWSGGYYEVVLVLGARSDERLVAASERLWQHARLDGPYASTAKEPDDQPRALPAVEVTDDGVTHEPFGVLTLPGNIRLPFSLFVWIEDGTDDVAFELPQGALSVVEPWWEWRDTPLLDTVDDFFVELATWVHAAVPLERAYMGEEVWPSESPSRELRPAPGGALRWTTSG